MRWPLASDYKDYIVGRPLKTHSADVMVRTGSALPQFGNVATAPRLPRTSGVTSQAAQWNPELTNPIRRLAFYASLGLIFLRYSLLHEVFAHYLGTSPFILYVLAVPALLGMAGSGGIQRTLASPQGKYWMGFIFWFMLAVPFSTWKGESFNYAVDYLRTDMPMLFIMAGLALSWQECRAMLYTIAIAGISNIAISLLITKSFGGRSGLEYGIVSNPNDYAGHLLFILPIILFLLVRPPGRLGSPIRFVARIAAITGILTGLFIVLMTGSRGGFIALAVGVVYLLWKSSTPVRIGVLIGAPLLFLVLFAALPAPVRNRLQSITTGQKDSTPTTDEAEESARLRRFLLDESVRISFMRPLFGVGPGQFGNFEGRAALWRSTHNSFTQISAECGIPGELFFLAAIFSSFLLLRKTGKQAKFNPQFREIEVACYCLALSFLVFCTAIFFLNFAYFFYLPAATGLAVVVGAAAQREFALARNQERRVAPVAPQIATSRATVPAPAPAKAERAVRFNGYR